MKDEVKRKEPEPSDVGDKEKPRKKRKSGWDNPPEGLKSLHLPTSTNTTTTAPVSTPPIVPLPTLPLGLILTPDQLKAVHTAQSFAAKTQIELAESLQKTDQQFVVAAAAQARTQAFLSRIYVGSLNFDLTEADVRSAFSPFGVIKNIELLVDSQSGKHRGFCFIEYANADSASTAIQYMNGALLGGRAIKVGRPHLSGTGGSSSSLTSMPSLPGSGPLLPLPLPGQDLPAQLQLQIQQQATRTRVYVGSLHPDLTSQDVQAVFSPFGAIKSCALVPNPETGRHKGFGILDFESHEAAQAAIDRMDGFLLAGKSIVVAWAPPVLPNLPLPSSALSAVQAQVQSSGGAADVQNIIRAAVEQHMKPAEDSLSNEENISISSSQRYQLMQKLSRAEDKANPLAPLAPTIPPGSIIHPNLPKPQVPNLAVVLGLRSPVICLRDMVGPDDVDAELELEVTEECSKFGIVRRVVIYKQSRSEDPHDVAVKIFVHFSTLAEAQRALARLDKRWFGGRQITAVEYSQEEFEKGHYDL